MIHEKIIIDKTKPNVYLSTYIIENSESFDKDKKRPAVLIFPGGGYMYTSDREAEFVALSFAAEGFHAFVLRYSTGQSAVMPEPILEACLSMAKIREMSSQWFIDENKIFVCGFSAGGHLASCVLTMWNNESLKELVGLDNSLFKPNGGILSYPCIVFPTKVRSQQTGFSSTMKEGLILKYNQIYKKVLPEHWIDSIFVKDGELWLDGQVIMEQLVMGKRDYTQEELTKYSTDLLVNEDVPPVFIWTTLTDKTVPYTDSVKFVNAMVEKNLNVEFHLFNEGPHGLSLSREETAGNPEKINERTAVWFQMAVSFLKKL